MRAQRGNLVLLGLGALAAFGLACGSDGGTNNGGGDDGLVQFEVVDTADSVGPEDADASAPDGGAETDSVAPDVSVTDDGGADLADGDQTADGGGSGETTFPDLLPDTKPPFVVSTSPADGEMGVAMPFVVSVTFDGSMYAAVLTTQTVRVYDVNEQQIPGVVALEEDRVTLTFTATGDTFFPASPYRLWLQGGVISDLAGNKMIENYEMTFFTAGYQDVDGYAALAGQYAPIIHSETDLGDGKAQAQIPTTFDADGDWNGANNKDWLLKTAKEITPAVYYDVMETRSHYFIQYMYFFPYVDHSSSGYEHGNGALGAVVVVEKARNDQPQRPVAVTTYWKEQQEHQWAFVTDESGIVGPHGDAWYAVVGSYPQETLFPGGHYEAWISPRDHESCLWIYTDMGGTFCDLSEGSKALMTQLVFAYDDGNVDVVAKDGSWPAQMSDFEGSPDSLGYQLVPILQTLWPRRLEVNEDAVFSATFTYKGAVGNGSLLPSRFVNPVADIGSAFGRPVWAWDWDFIGPGVPASQSWYKRGMLGMDPARYTMARHSSIDEDNTMVPFDPLTGLGFSTEYCFNGFANIDQRANDPLCQ